MASDSSVLEVPTNWRAEAWSLLQTVGIFVVIALLIRACLIEPFKIPSESMVPTLRIGDHLLVSKISYGLRLPLMVNSYTMWGTPERNDIVVFTRPDEPQTTEKDESDINLIKRVVGLPGETIEVHHGRVIINGQKLDEPFIRLDGSELDGRSDFPPTVIPEGHVFLMGDNRNNSLDSRVWEYHFLDIRRIKGRALFIYWSWDSFWRLGTIIR
jgi:signal peptidase I